MKNVVIAGYVRSPFAPATKGALAKVRPDDMAAAVVRGLIEKTGVKPEDLEDLTLGCAFPEAEQGFNLGRIVAFLADLPLTVGGMTMNRLCGSSMQAVHDAAGRIQMNAGEAFICAGVESMTRIPMGGYNPMPNPGLYERKPQVYIGMGETAEIVSAKFKISREDQEQMAVESHAKAVKAWSEGKMTDEIIPIGKVAEDGCIRPDTNLKALAGLKPAFREDGVVTAGTSAPLTDGAAAVLVCSEDYAEKAGLSPIARIKSIAISGCAPEIMGIGPVGASKKALERAGLKADDLDVIELNEAFAAQGLASARELGLDMSKVNIDGGGLAIGHPLGATGARITGKAAALLKREGGKYALATQCIGGGMGIATILEAI